MITYYSEYWQRNIMLDTFPGGFRELDAATGEILLEWVNGNVIWRANYES